MRRATIAFLILCMGACIKTGETVRAVRLHPDGKHVFLVIERHYLAPGSWTRDAIVLADLTASRKKEILSAGFLFPSFGLRDDFSLSPDGNYIMANTGRHLIIRDVRTGRALMNKKFESIYPTAWIWLPGSDRVSLTDHDGLKILSIMDGAENKLSDKNMYSLAWSSNGDFLICTDNHGWVTGGRLYRIDIRSQELRALFHTRSGIISYAAISNDATTIYIFVDLIEGRRNSLIKLDIQTHSTSEIWAAEREDLWTCRIILTADSKNLLMDSRAGINVLDLISNEATLVPFLNPLPRFSLSANASWDYDKTSNEIVMFDSSGSVSRRIGLK